MRVAHVWTAYIHFKLLFSFKNTMLFSAWGGDIFFKKYGPSGLDLELTLCMLVISVFKSFSMTFIVSSLRVLNLTITFPVVCKYVFILKESHWRGCGFLF